MLTLKCKLHFKKTIGYKLKKQIRFILSPVATYLSRQNR